MNPFGKLSLIVLGFVVLLPFQNCQQMPRQTAESEELSSDVLLHGESELLSLHAKWNRPDLTAHIGRSALSLRVTSDQKLKGEMHLAYEPPVDKPINWDVMDPSQEHPLVASLLYMINHVPKGEFIQLANYRFTYPLYRRALVAALKRGVQVQLVLTEWDHLDLAKKPFQEIIRPLGREMLTNGTGLSFINVCPKQSGSAVGHLEEWIASDEGSGADNSSDNEDDDISIGEGGCVHPEGKNHNKFFLFSRVCLLPLDSDGLCPQGPLPIMNMVIAQTSLNLTRSQLDAYNTLSFHIGEGELYKHYGDYFKSMVQLSRSRFKSGKLPLREGPKGEQYGVKRSLYLASQGRLNMNGMPFIRNQTVLNPAEKEHYQILDDPILSTLHALKCEKRKEGVTTIKISNAHWTVASNKKSRGDRIVEALSEKKEQGCAIQILGSRKLAPQKGSKKPKYHAAYVRLMESKLEVRSFQSKLVYDPSSKKYVEINPTGDHHTKYIVIDSPVKDQKRVMYGSMSFTVPSLSKNDEIWLDVQEPSSALFDFYNQSFDSQWQQLGVNP